MTFGTAWATERPRTVLDDVQAARELIAAMRRRRMILCPPEMVGTIRDCIESLGVGGLYTVEASQFCPPGKVLVADLEPGGGVEPSWLLTRRCFEFGGDH